MASYKLATIPYFQVTASYTAQLMHCIKLVQWLKLEREKRVEVGNGERLVTYPAQYLTEVVDTAYLPLTKPTLLHI